MLKNEINEIRDLIQCRLSNKIDDIILIGSCARNDKAPNDIDLIIKFKSNTSFEEVKKLTENVLENYIVFVEPNETKYHIPSFPPPPPKPKSSLPIHIVLSPTSMFTGSKIDILSKNDAISLLKYAA